VLFAIALVLYTPGIWWGLPHATAADRWHPWGGDELAPLGPVSELHSVLAAGHPTFNPQYPLFHYALQALAVGPYVAWLWLSGGIAHLSTQYPFGLVDPVSSLAIMTLLGRLVSLLMAAGVVVVAFRTGEILWDRSTGILAGLCVMLLYPMFYFSRTSNVDMAALFWTGLGMAVFAACLRGGLTEGRAAWLGLCAALATATKDASYAAFLAVGLFLVPWHLYEQRGRSGRWRPLTIGLLTAAGTYLLASGLIIRPARYLLHVDFILHGSRYTRGVTYYSTPATWNGYVSIVAQTARHIVDSMGAPMAFCALGGLALCLRRRPRLLACALPVLAIPLCVILPVRFVLLRFVFIMAYILALFAAHGLAESFRSRQSLLRAAAPVLLAIVSGWALLRGADLTWQMIADSRYAAAAWFHQHARPGDRIAVFGPANNLPALDASVKSMPASVELLEASKGRDAPEFIALVPVQDFQRTHTHETFLPEHIYQALRDGSLGYQQVLGLQTSAWFDRQLVSFVNPPVKVFLRKDCLAKMPGLLPQLEVKD
jgi:hypothetical protein